jgi:hypothetical protein
LKRLALIRMNFVPPGPSSKPKAKGNKTLSTKSRQGHFDIHISATTGRISELPHWNSLLWTREFEMIYLMQKWVESWPTVTCRRIMVFDKDIFYPLTSAMAIPF